MLITSIFYLLVYSLANQMTYGILTVVLFFLISAVNGVWGPWSLWSACTASCGPGSRERKRSCNSPAPKYGGEPCSGAERQVGDCSYRPCPGNYQSFPIFSKENYLFFPLFIPSCLLFWTPLTVNNIQICCKVQVTDLYLYFLCAVDGNYTEWTDWTVCDKTCGTGLMTRWRACSNPTPQYGGRDCSLFGPDMETKTCVMKDYCPSKFNA